MLSIEFSNISKFHPTFKFISWLWYLASHRFLRFYRPSNFDIEAATHHRSTMISRSILRIARWQDRPSSPLHLPPSSAGPAHVSDRKDGSWMLTTLSQIGPGFSVTSITLPIKITRAPFFLHCFPRNSETATQPTRCKKSKQDWQDDGLQFPIL